MLGDAFISCTEDDATKHCEEQVEKFQQVVDELGDETDEILDRQKEVREATGCEEPLHYHAPCVNRPHNMHPDLFRSSLLTLSIPPLLSNFALLFIAQDRALRQVRQQHQPRRGAELESHSEPCFTSTQKCYAF